MNLSGILGLHRSREVMMTEFVASTRTHFGTI